MSLPRHGVAAWRAWRALRALIEELDPIARGQVTTMITTNYLDNRAALDEATALLAVRTGRHTALVYTALALFVRSQRLRRRRDVDAAARTVRLAAAHCGRPVCAIAAVYGNIWWGTLTGWLPADQWDYVDRYAQRGDMDELPVTGIQTQRMLRRIRRAPADAGQVIAR